MNMFKLPFTKKENPKEDLTYQEKKRNLEGWQSCLITVVAITMSVFHIFVLGYHSIAPYYLFNIHISFAFILLFAGYIGWPTAKKSSINMIDWAIIGLVLIIGFYLFVNMREIIYRIGVSPTRWDIILGAALILLVLEGTRRTSGVILPLLAVIFILYAHWGNYIPGILGHFGFNWEMIISFMMGMEGIYGVPVQASASICFLFLVFSAFLTKSGAGDTFIDFSIGLTGRTRGGPAKVSIVASSLFGTISGNSVANVLTTGAFTIPMMKKLGYKPEFAGAVEATASTGGQLMPPIMGAAAFIMAEYLGIPYIRVAAGAAIPAIFYFLIAGILIYLQARKRNLKGLSKEEVPKVSKVLKEGFYNFIPIVFIVWVLVLGYSPMKAGFWAIFITIGLSYIKKETRLSFLDILECLEKGAKTSVPVVMACATAGIVVGSISLTGLGIRFSRFAIELAAGRQIILLIMIMISSIILGMGMPVSSAYIILAILGVPPLVGMGVEPLAAHMFVFYFGVISGLTPPVAITAYTAAGIAGSDPMKTGILSVLIGAGGFLLPYMFVYNPELLLISDSVINIILVCTQTIIACGAFAVFAQGYLCTKLNYIERGGFLLSSLMLVDGNLYTSSAALFVLTIVILVNYKRFRKDGQVFVDVKL